MERPYEKPPPSGNWTYKEFDQDLVAATRILSAIIGDHDEGDNRFVRQAVAHRQADMRLQWLISIVHANPFKEYKSCTTIPPSNPSPRAV